MKVLILDEKTWELAKKKIKAELHCAETQVSFCRGIRKRYGTRSWNEPWARKRHIEAIRLAKLLTQ